MFIKVITKYSKPLFTLLLVVVSPLLFAQQTDYRLPVTNTFSLQPQLFTPADRQQEPLVLNGNFHSYRGSFSDVNASYLSAKYQINKKRYLGGMLLYETTSDFFKRTRVYGLYQEEVKLSKQAWLRAGVQLGLVNFVLESVGFAPSGSAWATDIGMGLSGGTNKLTLGFAIQQLPSATLQPILFVFKLNQYTDFFLKYEFKLKNSLLKYIPEIRVQRNSVNNLYFISNTLTYKDFYGANINWIVDRGYSITAFYTAKNASQNKYRFFISYYMPMTSSLKNIDAQQYELGTTLLFNKK